MATTRDLEDGTGRPGRAIAREKDDGRGDVLGRAGPAEWRHREHHVGVLRPVLWVALPEHLVQDQARGDRVDADAMRTELDRENVGQHVHRRLAAGVVRASRAPPARATFATFAAATAFTSTTPTLAPARASSTAIAVPRRPAPVSIATRLSSSIRSHNTCDGCRRQARETQGLRRLHVVPVPRAGRRLPRVRARATGRACAIEARRGLRP